MQQFDPIELNQSGEGCLRLAGRDPQMPRPELTACQQPWWIALSAAIVALACFMRVAGIDRWGLDGDEVFSVMAAAGSWHGLLTIAATNLSHPPLYYLLLKLWMMIDATDEGWIRGLSVIFSIGGLIFVKKICDLLRLREVDKASVLVLMAANGLLVHYSQHARMFALLVLMSAVQLYVLLRFLQSRTTMGRVAGLVVANLLLVYSHYWGWLFLASEFVALLFLDRGKIFAFIAGGFLTVLGYLPWAWAIYRALATQGVVTAHITWMGANAPGFSDYVWLIAQLNGEFDFARSTVLGLLIFGAPICFFVITWFLGRTPVTNRMVAPVFWITLVAVPILLTAAASYLLKQNLWGTRHMEIVAVPYYVLIGLSLGSPRSAKIAWTARSIVLIWAIVSGILVAHADWKYDWRSIAREIAAVRDGGTPILASEPYVALPLQFQISRLIPTARVEVASDPSAITADHFWFVYRHESWTLAERPQQLFESAGYSVDHELATSWGSHTVTAMLVHR